ncbi:MAG: nucleoside-diphosphate kinase [Lentisphaeria bacterium]|nr:nucleoside-diphosphate kinase [Lentisphaeria bacterium]
MNSQTAVIFSPEAVKRQLCGVILSRLMTRGNLMLEAAGLINLNKNDAQVITHVLPEAAGFISDNCYEAAMICIFSGDNAVKKVSDILKNIEFSFGSSLAAAPEDSAGVAGLMLVIAGFANKSNLLTAAPQPTEERTLLIIKPENFRQPSARPGAIIDILMQLDLKWVGCKIHRMSRDEALEFYAPVRNALRKKLAPKIGGKALKKAEEDFAFEFDKATAEKFIELTGNAYADDQFEQIISFMTSANCMVLIFDGIDAVAKIRKVLGPTNPAEAAGGTVRYDFGTDIMVNAAHASDSPENYLRESAIIKVNDNTLYQIAAEYK